MLVNVFSRGTSHDRVDQADHGRIQELGAVTDCVSDYETRRR